MKKMIFSMLTIAAVINAETLFEVKDASNNKVLDISTDGLRVMNLGDTLMVISPSAVKVNLDNSAGKALSRTFSVTTTSAKGKGLTNVLEVGTNSTTMREGVYGDEYTNFSPQNLFLGINAGTNTVPTGTYGMHNVFLGNLSGVLNSDGSNNIFIGYNTGHNNISAMDNIFIGNYAGFNTESDEAPPYGSENVFIGSRSGYANIDGYDNVYIGNRTGEANTGGGANVIIGGSTGRANTKSNNTIVGAAALYQNTSGTSNTVLGTSAGTFNITGSGNVFLGYEAAYNETGSNKLYIENSNSASPLIWGDFANDLVKINGKLGVGISPIYKLHSEDITTTSDSPAVYGKHAVTDYYGIGVKGEGGYKGVVGTVTGTTTGEIRGVEGIASGTGGTRTGVYGSASGGSINWAGYFVGPVHATSFSTTKSEFKIDHPTDPENKYLSMSSVASDEMTNIINGNILLDSEGKATVKLPDWFEAANTDFKYQLTAIGAPGPNIYISKEISDNCFEISGGASGMKVSWMITAVRNDNFAKTNQIVNVTDKKTEEKGYYLHPEAFGKSEEFGIEYQTQKIEKTELK